MHMVIKSKKYNLDFDFVLRGGYICMRSYPSHEYKQICYYGEIWGDTLFSSPERFEKDCRNWYRCHLRRFADELQIDQCKRERTEDEAIGITPEMRTAIQAKEIDIWQELDAIIN